MLLTVLAFAVTVGVLIFVHELGHFLAAKGLGIQVLRFSLGFGKSLVSVRRGETEYVLAAIPLGGYVKMAGLEDEGLMGEVEGGRSPTPVDPARAFDTRPLSVRIVVILAGVTMNMIFAVLTYTGLFATIGQERIATTQVDTVYSDSLPKGTAVLRTLRRGDRIESVDGELVNTWEDLVERLATAPVPLRLTVTGRRDTLMLDLPQQGDVTSREAVVQSLEPFFPPLVKSVLPNLPAARGGLMPGDRVVAIDGDSVSSWSQFAREVRGNPHHRLVVTVVRGDRPVSLALVPTRSQVVDPRTGESGMHGYLGVEPVRPVQRTRYSPLQALAAGAGRAIHEAGQVVGYVKRLVMGHASFREVGGPITIGRISGQAARRGLPDLLGLMALLSVNLAVINLAPIPILDGGQLVFLLAEGVRRRPLSLKLRLALTQVGFVLIITLMVVVIGREFLGLFTH